MGLWCMIVLLEGLAMMYFMEMVTMMYLITLLGMMTQSETHNDILNGYFGEDRLVDNSGNDHLIGRHDANTLVCGLGYDTLIGFNSFKSEIKIFDKEVIKEGKNY